VGLFEKVPNAISKAHWFRNLLDDRGTPKEHDAFESVCLLGNMWQWRQWGASGSRSYTAQGFRRATSAKHGMDPKQNGFAVPPNELLQATCLAVNKLLSVKSSPSGLPPRKTAGHASAMPLDPGLVCFPLTLRLAWPTRYEGS
jgi:hypothetical protein